MAFDPLSYPIIVRLNVNGYVLITQKELNIRKAKVRWDQVKTQAQFGSMLIEVIEEIISRCSAPGATPPPTQYKEVYVKVADAAKRLGINQQTLRRRCDNGKIAFKKTKGGHRLVCVKEVIE